MFAAIAQVGAWINLFNLLPVWQLDGSRAFHALSRMQRFLVVLALILAWVLTHEGLLLLIAIVGAFRLFERRPLDVADWRTFVEFVGLVAALSAMTQIPVIVP
jgi:Zn-dependent protease